MSYTTTFNYGEFDPSTHKTALALYDLDLFSKFGSVKNEVAGDGTKIARYGNIAGGKTNGMSIAYTYHDENIKSRLDMIDPCPDMSGCKVGWNLEAIGTTADAAASNPKPMDAPYRFDFKFFCVDRVIDATTKAQLEKMYRQFCSMGYDKDGNFILPDLIMNGLERGVEV